MPSRAISVVLLLLASGCSWAGMVRPPPTPVDPSPPVACTTSRVAPALDTTAAVVVGIPSALFTGWAIANPVRKGPCSLFSATPSCSFFAFESGGAQALAIAGGLVGVGFAVMEAFAAADGYRWAARCEEIVTAQLACVSGVEPSCALLRKPGPESLKPPGARCDADAECQEGNVCYLGHCQVAR